VTLLQAAQRVAEQSGDRVVAILTVPEEPR
jgi:hypothetical protein